ncbi:hypothetical protein GGI03_003129 [Coemansia sp. RSA 2337]|nr:hypothetical protein GGI14_001174 [Coemansia sp. S680]KAJ2026010.1 hypothetical protein H4S03_008730 [Coemansia sp. S3946]KAJ2043129.1 hypothetical protein H4S04_006927 [Coemansia sp. S16]KAJ2061505.1 hypothetical protein GGH13_006612 [Coemansia sp. S155-1]KAJ2341641.1 hypothetical protein GGH92_005725 [Coemansia sp. RSA 2673]KAJ2464606.1 hypothetical protein GGI03_003129 [Coemansia sp. RSA 2337]
MRLPVLVTIWTAALASALSLPLEGGHASGLSKRLNSGSSFTRKGFDSIVQINLNNKKVAIEGCVGVLISPWHVLTQNVCLTPDPYVTTPDFASMTVTIGKTSSGSKKTLYKYTVSEIHGNDQFSNEQVSSKLAILTLNKEVKSSIAKPAKLYGGDYKVSTPAMLVGLATSGTSNSTASLNKMRYENVEILSNSYCLDANRNYDQVGEMCTLVKGGLNTCKSDFGAPIFTEVDNDGSEVEADYLSEGSEPSKKPAKAKAYALLALTANSVLPGKIAPPMGCSKTGSTGYYTWVYPFIEQIAAIIETSVNNITLVNNTLSTTEDPFLHPDMVTTHYGGVAKTASISAAALLVWAAAALF